MTMRLVTRRKTATTTDEQENAQGLFLCFLPRVQYLFYMPHKNIIYFFIP